MKYPETNSTNGDSSLFDMQNKLPCQMCLIRKMNKSGTFLWKPFCELSKHMNCIHAKTGFLFFLLWYLRRNTHKTTLIFKGVLLLINYVYQNEAPSFYEHKNNVFNMKRNSFIVITTCNKDKVSYKAMPDSHIVFIAQQKSCSQSIKIQIYGVKSMTSVKKLP